MPTPFLLAETPRAGEMNHRFICSPGAGVTDEAASALAGGVALAAGPAGDRATGANYIAVIRRGVFQVRSDRRGDEILMLVGINPAAVDADAVADRLGAVMAGMGDVAEDVATRPGILVEHPRLGEWLAAALSAAGLGPDRPAAGPAGWAARHWRVLAVAAVIAVCAVCAAVFLRPSARRSPGSELGTSPTGGAEDVSAGGQPPSEGKPARSAWDALYAEVRCGDDKTARQEIQARVGHPDKIPELLEQLRRDAVDPYTLLSVPPAGLPKGRLPRDTAARWRDSLAHWRDHLAAIRAECLAAGLPILVKKNEAACPTLALIAELGKNDPPYTALDGPPATPLACAWPWLDPAERQTAEALDHLLFRSAAGKAYMAYGPERTEPTSLAAGVDEFRAFEERGKSFTTTFTREQKKLGEAAIGKLAKLKTFVKKLCDDINNGVLVP